MKKIGLSILFALAATVALAQGPGPGPGPGPTPDPWVVNGSAISYNGCVLVPASVGGGCKGNGTINATAIYQAGFQVLGTLANGKIFIGNDSAVGIAQTPSGDLTMTNTGVFTVSANVITNAKLAQAAATTLKGNPTNATANVQDFTLSGLSALASPNTTLDLLLIWDHTAGTFKSVTPSAITTAVGGITALTGDVAATGPGSVAATIQAGVVTYAKFQTVAASSLIGNPTAGLATSQAISLGTTLSFSGTSLRTAAATGDVTWAANSFATTLATVNSNVGTFGSATQASQITVNGKGLVTAAANVTVTPAVGSITGLGTGVATALGINIGSAGAFITFNGAGGTPSSMVGTNITGTAAGLTAGNVTTNANLTGPITSVGNATAIASQTGTGSTFVMSTAPMITGGQITNLTDFSLRNTGTGAFNMSIVVNDTMTAGRNLTFDLNDASRSITMSGNVSFGGAFTTSAAFTQAGAFTTTITSTATTNATFPAGTHTLAAPDVVQNWSATQSFDRGVFVLNGTSGSQVLQTAATSSGTITLPAGTVNFSATGGTSQVVKQTSVGGIFTVAQLAFSDISGSVAASQMPALTGDVTTSAGAVATTITANAVTNAKAAQMAAYTFKGNVTGSTANATDFTIAGLANKAAPVGGDLIILADSAASNATKYATLTQALGAVTSGVSALNSLTGGLTIANGNGIAAISAVTTTITISADIASSANFYGATANKLIDASVPYTAVPTPAFSATPTFDFGTASSFAPGAMTANITSMTCNNLKPNQSGFLKLTQDGVGGRTAVFCTPFKWANGIAPTLSTAASAVDWIFYSCQTSSSCAASILPKASWLYMPGVFRPRGMPANDAFPIRMTG